MLAFLCFIIVLSTDFSAQGAELTPGETGVVIEVSDGDTLTLSDGLVVRLVGLQAPKLPLGRSRFLTWPMAPESRDALKDLVLRRAVTLSYGGTRRDRHGRALAHLHRTDGLWVQGEMIARGLARVYSFQDNRTCVTELLDIERQARVAHQGLWALDAYRIYDPSNAFQGVDGFQIVEGRVLDAKKVRDWIYLNFGADWRRDFTVSISVRHQNLFEQKGWDLLNLQGKKIRVRGWLGLRNGPHIQATHPEQIEQYALSPQEQTAHQNSCSKPPS